MEQDYCERALIKLYRKYGKDELIKSLLKKLTDMNIELDKSVSYIKQLKLNIKDISKSKTRVVVREVANYESEYLSQKSVSETLRINNKKLKEKIKALNKEVKARQETINRLINKIHT